MKQGGGGMDRMDAIVDGASQDLGPVTYNRALTAIVQCGSHLRKAHVELRLAVDILTRLDDPTAPWPMQASRRARLLRPLEEFLDRLARNQDELRDAAQATEGGDRLRSA
jgi:hypothetical protein